MYLSILRPPAVGGLVAQNLSDIGKKYRYCSYSSNEPPTPNLNTFREDLELFMMPFSFPSMGRNLHCAL